VIITPFILMMNLPKKHNLMEELLTVSLSLSIGLGLLHGHIDGFFLYGFNKIRFLNPLKPGNTIHYEITFSEKKEKENFDLYYFDLTLFDQMQKKIFVSEIILGKMK